MPRKGGVKENLIPFKKGKDERRNLKGAPKLPDLKMVMAEILAEEKDGVSALKAIVAKLRQLAASGNIKAAELLLDRGFGKPKQEMDIDIKSNIVRSFSLGKASERNK